MSHRRLLLGNLLSGLVGAVACADPADARSRQEYTDPGAGPHLSVTPIPLDQMRAFAIACVDGRGNGGS